jgi:hypothetical protein
VHTDLAERGYVSDRLACLLRRPYDVERLLPLLLGESR